MGKHLLVPCLLLVAGAAWSGTLPGCITAKLTAFDVNGLSCAEGPPKFGNFNFFSDGSAPAEKDNQDAEKRAKERDGTGLTFLGPLDVGAGLTLDVVIHIVTSAGRKVVTGGQSSSQEISGSEAAEADDSTCADGNCSSGTADASGVFHDMVSDPDTLVPAVSAQTSAMVHGGSVETTSSGAVSASINAAPGLAVIPEPHSLLLLGSGLVIASALLRRKIRG